METERKSDNDNGRGDDQKDITLFKLSMRDLSNVTLVLPLSGLFVCLITGYIFQPDEIHETHCKVFNVIPSISSITGISPQRYLWRLVVALHIDARLIIAFVHKNFLRQHILSKIPDRNQSMRANQLAKIVHYLSLVEISALAGVTYISNKENYPMHEKIFIVFMITSQTSMLVYLKLLKILHSTDTTSLREQRSVYYKKMFFALSIVSTIGLIVFFLKHRLLCHDLAFSFFALCEYLIAFSNMGFHYTTTVFDFPPKLNLVVKSVDGHLKVDNKELKND